MQKSLRKSLRTVFKLNRFNGNAAVDPAAVDPVAVESRIREEQLRQAKHSFNLSFSVIVASAIVGFASAGLMLQGRVTLEMAATSATVISALCQAPLKFSRDVNDRLQRGSGSRSEQNSE